MNIITANKLIDLYEKSYATDLIKIIKIYFSDTECQIQNWCFSKTFTQNLFVFNICPFLQMAMNIKYFSLFSE